jgi:hypothetical protein
MICNSISLYPMTKQFRTETRRKERLDNTNRKEQHIKQHVGESSTEPNQTAKNSRSQSPLFPVVNRAKKRKGKGRKQKKTHTKRAKD